MLDKIDVKILTELQNNARITNLNLAEKVNLSPTPCLKRVRKLEDTGVIQSYRAVLNSEKMGYNVNGIILLKISNMSRDAVNDFNIAIKKIPAITECYMTTGRIDYIARIYAKDFSDYEAIVKDELGSLPNIVSMETLFLFSNVVSDGFFKL